MAKNDSLNQGVGTERENDLVNKACMKRIGNLYQRICSIENLNVADAIARKGKAKQPGIKAHDLNREENIQQLHGALVNKSFRTSQYTTFKVYEPKEREVFRLPYFPDRIVHHAIMNVLEPIFCSIFTADTYSCIKGKGIHAAARGLKRVLNDLAGTTYCLKLDIKKFYPSVDHAILKQLLRRKFKDQDLLWMLDEIIDSADGLPIGNYLSQYLANYYLTYFDHWLKEEKRVRFYFRYADDLVILHHDKAYLHALLSDISAYLENNLKLTVKKNYQVFPVSSRGIDFLGYRFFNTHTKLRKGIKQNFARMLAQRPNRLSIASYYGWCCHANCGNLLNTLLSNERIQRFPDHYLPKSIYRRQNKDRPHFKPGDRGTRFQSGAVSFRKRQWQMPLPADRTEPDKTCGIHWISGINGNDKPGTQRQIPFQDNNC